MAGEEGEDKKMEMNLSMQEHESPERKRSKPMDATDAGEGTEASGKEFLSADNILLQRELVAATGVAKNVEASESEVDRKGKGILLEESDAKSESPGMMLSVADANQIFYMTFGKGVSKDVLSQWSNQGIRWIGLLVYLLWKRKLSFRDGNGISRHMDVESTFVGYFLGADS